MSVESDVVDFAQSLTWSELPVEVREAVTRLTGDAIANAVVGRGAADTTAIEAASRSLYGDGDSSIIAGTTSSMVAAAGINAFQTTAYTMCDVYRPGLCHVTPEVVPAALAVAEQHNVDGPSFLAAVAAGFEVTTRLCRAFNYPVFRARGWHSPGISGAMGASISTGLLAGLTPAGLAGCLGLAGSQASGSFAAMGTMAVKFHQLRGAQAAVISAVHAQHSLTGATNVLTASDGGLLRAFSDDPDPSQLTDGLGARWSLLDIALRPYPAASTLQSLINVLMDPEVLDAVQISDVREVRVELPDEAYRLGAEAGWESELRAMQSARFIAAGVLLTRQCWIELFAEQQRRDQRLDAFAREKVSVVRNSDLRDGAVRVTLVTSFGERHLASDASSGDPLNPMTGSQLLAKVRRCLSSSRVADSFDRERLVHLERETSMATLLRDLREASDPRAVLIN